MGLGRLLQHASVGLLLTSIACDRDGAATPAPSASPSVAASVAAPPAASATNPARPRAKPLPPLPAEEFGRLVSELSETDEYFFSDNYVSNETSYLQPAGALEGRVATRSAYLGVGPEQNFTYIALTRPEMAFIIDIRRANMLLHLLYKAVFDQAKSRAHFLTLLVGRPWDERNDPGEKATVAQVIEHAELLEPNEQHFESLHESFVHRIENQYKTKLNDEDKKRLQKTHRAFFDGQLDIAFELLEQGGREYPKLRELLAAEDPEGKLLGFLASEDGFRTVQALQKAHRVVPVVGDFAGKKAVPGVAKELARRDLPVGVFYVSNVEQYLLEDGKWAAWNANIDALPTNEKSLFLRAYLDQGKRHPRQMKGHRTTSVIQTFDHFRWSQKKTPFKSFYEVSTRGVLDAGP